MSTCCKLENPTHASLEYTTWPRKPILKVNGYYKKKQTRNGNKLISLPTPWHTRDLQKPNQHRDKKSWQNPNLIPLISKEPATRSYIKKHPYLIESKAGNHQEYWKDLIRNMIGNCLQNNFGSTFTANFKLDETHSLANRHSGQNSAKS